MASEVLRGLPSGTETCRVTVFADEIHWVTDPDEGVLDLQLEWPRNHWIMLPTIYDDRMDMRDYSGNGAPPSASQAGQLSRPPTSPEHSDAASA